MTDQRAQTPRAAANPLDDLAIQVPGRLLTLEVLLALLIRESPRRLDVLREAEAMLARIEEQFAGDLEEGPQEKLRQMFVVSRAWLEKIGSESGA